jgi:hypothetical protein
MLSRSLSFKVGTTKGGTFLKQNRKERIPGGGSLLPLMFNWGPPSMEGTTKDLGTRGTFLSRNRKERSQPEGQLFLPPMLSWRRSHKEGTTRGGSFLVQNRKERVLDKRVAPSSFGQLRSVNWGRSDQAPAIAPS